MTFRGPGSRRDLKAKGGNVIKGYRLEPDAAKRLTDYARKHCCDEHGICDIAVAARFILRSQLGWPVERTSDPDRLPESTRGMKVEKRLLDALTKYSETHGLSFVGTIRHLLRLGLGFNADLSLLREQRFAEIVAIKKEIMEAG